MPDHRRNLGALGEGIACRHLRARGYEVVDRNFRTRHGELDVVAALPRCLVFCEVKTRLGRRLGSEFPPLSAVGPRKRRRLRAMAREWLASARAAGCRRPGELRFDAIGVTVDLEGRLLPLEHVENAF